MVANSDFGDPILRLLPSFDPYMLGHVDKNHLLDSSYYKRVYRNQGWISPVVLLNGRVIGIWSYSGGRKQCSVKIEPLEKFSKITHIMLDKEAASLGNFLSAS
jgi:hypothetical protein